MSTENRFAVAVAIRNPLDNRTLFGLRSKNYHSTFTGVWSLPSIYITSEEASKLNESNFEILKRLSNKKLGDIQLIFKKIIRYAKCSRKEYNLHMYLVLADLESERIPSKTNAYDELRFMKYDEFWGEAKEYGFCGLCTALFSEWLFLNGEISASQVISRINLLEG